MNLMTFSVGMEMGLRSRRNRKSPFRLQAADYVACPDGPDAARRVVGNIQQYFQPAVPGYVVSTEWVDELAGGIKDLNAENMGGGLIHLGFRNNLKCRQLRGSDCHLIRELGG